MALALADSIGKTGWNLTDQMNRYCDWWQNGTYSVNGRCFDIGTQTRYALNEFLDTNQARSGDTDEANSGNGSIMRLAPVAIKYADLFPARIEELSIIAEDSSATTHPSPQCTSACRYMALVLAALINGEEKKDVLSPDWKYLNELNEIKPLHKLVQKVAEGSFRSGKVKGSGWVIESLEAALWAFSSSSGFDQAVLKAANLGNDADTTAAVCGQFAGAYWGETGISYTPFRDELDRKDMIEEALASLGVGKHY
jgi:ADP-ribosyl-[dinitrogen reductase] hydrolase